MNTPICIFDMDDTLVDSWMRLKECSLIFLDEAGIAYDEAEVIRRIIPLGSRGSAKLYHEMGVPLSVEAILQRKNELHLALYRDRVHPKEGVIALLERLKSSGVRMFVLSATAKELVDMCLASNRMEHYFEAVWSVDEFGATKSEPRLFARVASRLGVAPGDIHYFEDSLAALKNARLAGFVTYAVENHNTPAEIDEMKAQNNAFIGSFADFVPPAVLCDPKIT